MTTTALERELLERTLQREHIDERAAATRLLAMLDRLERQGIIACQFTARRRLARMATPDLRRELHLQAGLALAAAS